MTIEELSQEIKESKLEMQKEINRVTMTMIGVIVSIWAVTLITASTLYIITRGI